ncbi:hypothetical protein GOQ28_09680 [Bordetella sp. 02P26C-1]|nr:hypothetical protein [Bordetella sp. 02P26C-1]
MKRQPLPATAPHTSMSIPGITMSSHRHGRRYDCPKAFLWAFALYFIAIMPILRADRYYVDDMGRALTGYLGWSGDGRPLANVFMEVFNLGTPLTDISPLPQIVSIAILAALAVSVARYFRINGTILPALVFAPMVIGPFFLENLSYKFDALTMTLAVFLALVTVLKTRADLTGALLGILGLVASLSLYQPAFNVFLVFTTIQLVYLQRQDAPVPVWAGLLVMRVAQALAALILYKPLAASSIKGAYSARHSQLAPFSDLPAVVGRNVLLFWDYVTAALTSIWGRTLLIWIAAAIIIALGFSIRYIMRHWAGRPAWQRLLMVVAALGIVPALVMTCWGPMLALLHPVLLPRTMIGFGALAAGASLLIVLALPAHLPPRWQAGIAAVPLLGLVLFSHVYGNTLKLQKDLEDSLARQISDDLAVIAAERELRQFTMIGHAARPAVARNNMKKYPLLGVLVPVHLKDEWGWPVDQLQHFGLTVTMAKEPERPELIKHVCHDDAQPIVRRGSYRVYVADDLAVVVLGEAKCEAP